MSLTAEKIAELRATAKGSNQTAAEVAKKILAKNDVPLEAKDDAPAPVAEKKEAQPEVKKLTAEKIAELRATAAGSNKTAAEVAKKILAKHDVSLEVPKEEKPAPVAEKKEEPKAEKPEVKTLTAEKIAELRATAHGTNKAAAEVAKKLLQKHGVALGDAPAPKVEAKAPPAPVVKKEAPKPAPVAKKEAPKPAAKKTLSDDEIAKLKRMAGGTNKTAAAVAIKKLKKHGIPFTPEAKAKKPAAKPVAKKEAPKPVAKKETPKPEKKGILAKWTGTLTKLVNEKKKLAHYRGTSEGNLKRDAGRPAAKARGKRISKSGHVYYENRANRTDVNPQHRYVKLETGGRMAGLEGNSFNVYDGDKWFLNQSREDVIAFANTITHYDRQDNDEGEITDFAQAVKVLLDQEWEIETLPVYTVDSYEERGVWTLDVTDTRTDKSVFAVRYEGGEDETTLIDDGYMRHMDDFDGLKEYLVQMEVIEEEAKLVDIAKFEFGGELDDEEDDDGYQSARNDFDFDLGGHDGNYDDDDDEDEERDSKPGFVFVNHGLFERMKKEQEESEAFWKKYWEMQAAGEDTTELYNSRFGKKQKSVEEMFEGMTAYQNINGEMVEVGVVGKDGKFARGGRVHQNAPQNPNYNFRNDKERGPSKPAGWRYTAEGAKKLGMLENATPSATHIAQYKGKTFKKGGKEHRYLYQEARKDKSDVSRSYPYLEKGGRIRQNPPQGSNYDWRNDREAGPTKPAGWRYTDAGARKLGVSAEAVPFPSHIEKYRGKTFVDRRTGDEHRYLYQEARKDKSDVSRDYPYLEKGGTLQAVIGAPSEDFRFDTTSPQFEKGGVVDSVSDAMLPYKEVGKTHFIGRGAVEDSARFEAYLEENGIPYHYVSFTGLDHNFYDPYHAKNAGTKYEWSALNENGYSYAAPGTFKLGGRLHQAAPQNPDYNFRNDKDRGPSKPVGWRYTSYGAAKLGMMEDATPVPSHIAKYKGKTFKKGGVDVRYLYYESRKDKSDHSRSFPYLEQGGQLAGGLLTQIYESRNELPKSEIAVSQYDELSKMERFGYVTCFRGTCSVTMKGFQAMQKGHFAKGGKLEGQPEHFGKGRNIDVFGYNTQHFVNAADMVEEFERAVKQVKEGGVTAKESPIAEALKEQARLCDKILKAEAAAEKAGSIGVIDYNVVLIDFAMCNAYSYKAGLKANACRLNKSMINLAKLLKG